VPYTFGWKAMHDGWSRFCGMKACFIGCLIGGGWFTSYSAIGSSTLNSSSSTLNSSFVSGLSLGLCRMVCSISGSIGTMVEFLDKNPCLKKISFCNYNNFSVAV
jgi:hypothetical protein